MEVRSSWRRSHPRVGNLGGFVFGEDFAVGAAQGVARAFDAAGWPEVVGSLAGDDTVFLATATERDQERLLRHLAVFMQET